MSPNPPVSVIIPSYNHAQYISQAIESVLAQTYDNLELIIVDDGSSDNSPAVIQNYAEKENVTIILNADNRGQSAVFNQALEIAKGEYIALLPSDDWYLPNKIEKQVQKFKESGSGVGLVYSKGLRYFEDTRETIEVSLPAFTGDVAKELITWGNFVYPVTPLFRRKALEMVRMDDRFKAEGEAIYVKIALQFKFEFVDEHLAVMRDHSYNIGKNVDVMYDEVVRYWEMFFEHSDLPPSLAILRQDRMAKIHRVKGMQFIGERRNFSKGRQCLLRAIKEKPTLLLRPKFAGALAFTYLPEKFANAALDVAGKSKPN